MKFPLGVMMILVMLLIISSFSLPLLEMGIIQYYGTRIHGDLLASGWAAFSEYDLENFAERTFMADREERPISLDQVEAENIVRDYLKDNLQLDDAYYPLSTSYIRRKDLSVVIKEITIINPEDLPYDTGSGMLTETAIYMDLDFPVRKDDPAYLNKKIYVMADSFLLTSQK